MESGALLQVPITARERRVSREHHERLLAQNAAYERARDHDPAVGRFRSLRGASPRFERPASTTSVSSHESVELPNTTDVLRSESPVFEHDNLGSKGGYAQLRHPPRLWTPIWLRKATLCFFAILFLALLAGLLTLRHFSDIHNGFSVHGSTSYYAWTYGPTAFLVIIISLWRQVDFYCKALTPWDELRRGPISATQSLLADYLSPLQVLSLITALKRRRIAIVLTITGFALLKVLTIFSTGLLVLLPTTIETDSFPASTLHRFDASSFNRTASVSNLSFPSRLVYTRLGNIAYNLPFPNGVTNSFAFIPANLGDLMRPLPKDASYSYETDAFMPEMACNTIDVTIDNPATIWLSNATSADNSTDDVIRFRPRNDNVCAQWPNLNVSAIDPQLGFIPSGGRQVMGMMQGVDCANDSGLWTGYGQTNKVLFTVADLQYTQDLNVSIAPNLTITNSSRTVISILNIVCSISYNIGRAHISNSTNTRGDEPRVSLIESVMNNTLNNLSNINVTNLYLGAWNLTYNHFVGNSSTLNFGDTLNQNSLFKLMAINSGSQDISILLEDDNLQTSAESTFKGIMSYYALDSLVSSGPATSTANATYVENRLHVDRTPFWVMAAGFATLTLLSILLLVSGLGPVVPRNPFSIAANATTLANSIELNHLLQSQHVPFSNVGSSALICHQFESAIGITDQGVTSFQIVVLKNEQSTPQRRQIMSKWWTPVTVGVTFYVCTLGILLSLIATLEVLQHLSDQHQGLFTLSDNWRDNAYAHILPALLVLLVATTINSIDFNQAVYSPWSKLRKGNATAKQVMFNTPLGEIPPLAFFGAFRTGLWGAVFSTVAAVSASLFIIAVSGLFVSQTFQSSGTARNLVQSDTFKLQNYYDPSDDHGAGTVFTLLNGSNLGYPAGTYDEFALPMFSLGDSNNTNTSTPGDYSPLTAQIPVYRGNLRCEVMPQTAIDVNYSSTAEGSDDGLDLYSVISTFTLPTGCGLVENNVNTSEVTMALQYTFSNTAKKYFAGTMVDLDQSILLSATTGEEVTQAVASYNTNNSSCPSLGFVFGKLTPGSDSIGSLTVLTCYQEIQTVTANVTFQPNTTSLDSTHPPVLNETSAIALANPNSTTGTTAFHFHINSNLQNTEQMRTATNPDFSEDSEIGYDFDAFFAWCINGTDYIDPTSLVGTSNQAKLLATMNHVYRRYMAQVYSLVLRDPPAGRLQVANNHTTVARQDDESTIQAQTTVSRSRLVLDKASRIALEVLLALSAVSITIAYFMTSTRKILPNNPCSIAGTMSLLAGSDLCYNSNEISCVCCKEERRNDPGIGENISAHSDELEPEALHREQIIVGGMEFMNDKDFKQVFANGKRYSMGWWAGDVSRGRKERYGVDIGARPDAQPAARGKRGWTAGHRRDDSDTIALQPQGLQGLIARGRDPGSTFDSRGTYQRADASPNPEDDHEADIPQIRRPDTVSPSIYEDDESNIFGPYQRRFASPYSFEQRAAGDDSYDVAARYQIDASSSLYDDYPGGDIGVAVSDGPRPHVHGEA